MLHSSRHPQAALRRNFPALPFRFNGESAARDVHDLDPIVRVQMAADMPKAERPSIQVTDTTSKEFADYKAQRRNPAPTGCCQ